MEEYDLKYQLTASIVLYEENPVVLRKTINSFLAIPLDKKLFLIDNSRTDKIRNEFDDPQIEYRFVGKNIGFGSGHNQVLTSIKNQSTYHLILNPDLQFDPQVVPNLITEMVKHENLALIAPKILYPNGSLQISSRRFPSLFELKVRAFPPLKRLFKKIIGLSEYSDLDLNKPFKPDILHACFYILRTEKLIALEGFDERYFLYIEDIDFCRKIDQLGMDKLYFPLEYVYHELRKGSSNNLSLFFIHVTSVIKYFLKWGFSSKKR